MNGRSGLPRLRDPMQSIALGYAPGAARRGLHAVWALDAALGDVVRTTTQPMIGQIRLAWWRERLETLGDAPGEPILAALAQFPVIAVKHLIAMVDGWEVLIGEGPLIDDAITEHAGLRGGGMFAASADVLGQAGTDPACGAGWAAADLARHWSDVENAGRARAFAVARLATCRTPRAKPLRILVRGSRLAMRQPVGAPLRRRDLARAVIF